MIPLPKFCSFAQLPLLIACTLQLGSLIALLVENAIEQKHMPRDRGIDYIMISFTMFVLLFFARNTAKDLLKQNCLDENGASPTGSNLLQASKRTNNYNETEFEGSFYSNIERPEFITKEMKARENSQSKQLLAEKEAR